MSRINDALKRAQAAQQSPPPPSSAPQWQPPAPEQMTTRGIGLTVPFVFALIALLGLLFVWQIRQKRAAENRASAQRELLTAATPVRETAPQPAALVQPVAASTSTATMKPRLQQKPVSATASPAAPAPQVVTVPPPAPPPLKLQGVLFSGQNSSAMVSGQTVLVGDSLGEYRVTAINPRSVTLVSATRTNILTLSE